MPGNKFIGLPAELLHELLYHVIRDYILIVDNPASTREEIDDNRKQINQLMQALEYARSSKNLDQEKLSQ